MRCLLARRSRSLILAVTVIAVPAVAALTPSEKCGMCHRDIYRMWKDSAHSRSMESMTFLDAYDETEARHGADVAKVCIKCHAPLLEVIGDSALTRKVTWEGVNCDSCHNLVDVDLSGRTPKNVFEPGPVKRGPIRDAESLGHEVAYSELHTKSQVCAGCHEYVNPGGTPILTTYSEWEQSSFGKKGTSCQECHMGKTSANVVEPRIKRVSSFPVNIHEVPGSHSLDMLHKALGTAIDLKREAGKLIVSIRLTNKGAGHSVPTGMPGRRVILDLDVQTTSGGSFSEERVYARFLKDATGLTVIRDSDHFAPGVEQESDSRFKPDETREELFRFPLAEEDTAYVTVKLHYEHSPLGTAEGRTRLTFLSERRSLRPERSAAMAPMMSKGTPE